MTKRSDKSTTLTDGPKGGERTPDAAAASSPSDTGADALSEPLSGGASVDAFASLDNAHSQWLVGAGDELAKLDLREIDDHPERDRVALLAACAHQRRGAPLRARQYVWQALDWGCPRNTAARILVAELHGTLGRISALAEKTERASTHFEAAARLGGARDVAAVKEARIVREMIQLGLLPQAGAKMKSNLYLMEKMDDAEQRQAAFSQLKVEIELLHEELSLAARRNQLYGSAKAGDAEPIDLTDKETLRRLSTSQLEQDLWVLERSGFKKGGFFVEFGATDGVMLNNTLLLEKYFDWEGLLAEPNPKFVELLKRNRSVQISDACIGGVSGEVVEFVCADVFGGILKHANVDKHGDRRHAYAQDKENVLELKTISLHDFLVANSAPKTIDYISVDTEGSEWEILRHFPFDEWDVRTWTVEHNFTENREKIHDLMTAHGYVRVPAQWDDWYYRALQPTKT